MKVLCIKHDSVTVQGKETPVLLKEGECYTVIGSFERFGNVYYELDEIWDVRFNSNLFIPCSDIDEREIVYNLQTQSS